MSQSLNISYRPTKLSQVVGQDAVVKALSKILTGKIETTAFLFYGIRGIGKTTLSRILACSLACTTPVNGEACGSCESCLAFKAGSHLDIIEMDAASRTGVDDVREIINACQYTAVIGRCKVFIIDEVHMLSKSAFNALLKTLEEPPVHVKFIFATTEVNKIPDTVQSRCLTFHLRPLPINVLSNHLISVSAMCDIELSQDAAEMIADEAEGSVRDALSLLKQASLLTADITCDTITTIVGGARTRDIKNLLVLITDGKVSDALICVKSILAGGADAFSVYKQLQKELYSKIVDAINNKNLLTRLLYLWQILLKQADNLNGATYPDCVLGAMVVVLAHAASFPDIGVIINAPNENNNNLLNNILAQFPKSVVTEIE